MFQSKLMTDYSLTDMEPVVDNLNSDYVKIKLNEGAYEETEIRLNEKQMQILADQLIEIGYADTLKDKIHQLENSVEFYQEKYNTLYDKMVEHCL